MSAPDRRARLDRVHSVLSIRRQRRLLGIARSGVYRTPSPANDNDLALTVAFPINKTGPVVLPTGSTSVEVGLDPVRVGRLGQLLNLLGCDGLGCRHVPSANQIVGSTRAGSVKQKVSLEPTRKPTVKSVVGTGEHKHLIGKDHL
jgi:putative transposase